MVSCRGCRHFLADAIGDGTGIGSCSVFDAYKAKNPGNAALRAALVTLGNRPDCDVFWGGGAKTRECGKYDGV